MKTKEVKTTKGVVKQLRAIRDKINVELEKMTAEQRTEYFRKMREKSSLIKR